VIFDNGKDALKWQRLESFRKFATIVEAHWDGIEAYCHEENKVVLGFVEGLNNKIRHL
jgi:transposase